MSDKSFIDSNILVYAYDASEKIKHEKAFDLLAQLGVNQTGVISLQVLSEFFVVVTRKIEKPISLAQAKKITEEFIENWEVYEPTTSTLLLAMEIAEKNILSFWDGLILAAAKETKSSIIYSEDLQHNQIIEEIRIVNSFKILPS